MDRQLSLLAITVLFFVGAGPPKNDEMVRQELAKLDGRWLIESIEWGNQIATSEQIAMSEGEKRVWQFSGGQLTRFVDSKIIDVVQCEIHPQEIPKQIDFVPVKGGEGDQALRFLARTKCIYSLEDDELKIGLTAEFLPGSPEEEKRRGLENAKKRPKTFDGQRDDVLILNFKREKKAAP